MQARMFYVCSHKQCPCRKRACIVQDTPLLRTQHITAQSHLCAILPAGALAAGVPFQWLPAPLVAACGLALFYESRSLREYLVFVVGAFVTGRCYAGRPGWAVLEGTMCG